MNKINLPQAAKLTSPNPVTVVCTQKPDGSTNLATVSWWTYLSFKPNMIAYAMAKTSYSGEMVRDNRKVILTIPGAEMAEAVMGCGSTTGRDTDKAAKFGIELAEVDGSDIKIPAHSRVARNFMRLVTIICISVMWSRYMEMKQKKPCLHGMGMPRCVRQSKETDVMSFVNR